MGVSPSTIRGTINCNRSNPRYRIITIAMLAHMRNLDSKTTIKLDAAALCEEPCAQWLGPAQIKVRLGLIPRYGDNAATKLRRHGKI